MKTVNVRQLENNPSDALRMARKAPVVVMNRDRPEAVLLHLDNGGLLGEPACGSHSRPHSIRATVLLGRGAKIAGMVPEEFMRHVSRQGIPVVKGDAATGREDVRNLEAWRKRRRSLTRVR